MMYITIENFIVIILIEIMSRSMLDHHWKLRSIEQLFHPSIELLNNEHLRSHM